MRTLALRRVAIVGVLASVVAAGTACTPNDVKGRVECGQDAAGKVTCSYAPDVAPTSSTPAPTTTPKPVPTSSTPAPTVAPVPTTSTPAPTTPPVVAPPTTPPVTADGVTAAALKGWGTPLAGSDEFNYTGRVDGTKWDVAGECWSGHAGNGKRCASRSTVDGNKLVQTGTASGDSAWLGSKTNQRYGKWEARVRSKGAGAGNPYHPLLIIWPQSNRWPQDGEYDFLENGRPGEACAESFIHYPHAPGATQQEFKRETSCGAPLTEWHNVAIEWTPEFVAGYIDGKQWFKYAGGANAQRQAIQNMPSGHLTIQLDNFYGAGMQPATYEIDWVRIYR